MIQRHYSLRQKGGENRLHPSNKDICAYPSTRRRHVLSLLYLLSTTRNYFAWTLYNECSVKDNFDMSGARTRKMAEFSRHARWKVNQISLWESRFVLGRRNDRRVDYIFAM
jgi:hypothetical protein